MTTVAKLWPDFEKLLNGALKTLQLQDVSDDEILYKLIAIDGPIVYTCTIWKAGAEPPTLVDSDLSNNTGWRTDYEANWASRANAKLDSSFQIKQERLTAGHYHTISIYFDVPANAVAYHDLVVPDLTHGWDWINCDLYAGDATSGDFIATGKMMGGQVAQVASPADQDATTIVLAAPVGLLRSTRIGGVLDEGYYLSFGADTVTDAGINAVSVPPGTGSLENPEPELREYEIRRIGTPTDVGGGVEAVTITLMTALAAQVNAGTAANLVVRAFPRALRVTKGKLYDLGGRALSAGNIPAGTRVRLGYKNTAGVGFTPTAELEVFYG